MTTIFDELSGFNLKLPLSARNYLSSSNSYGEWIEITKNPNELPTVKLRTIVLYYRNNGVNTSFDADTKNIPTSLPVNASNGGNYRFYNNVSGANGRQLGWI